MGESYDRFYHDQVDPITADKRDRVIPRSNIRRLVVALDVAGNDVPFRLRGDFLYADNNTSGNVTCKLNNTSEDPFPLLAQAGLTDMPFEDIYLTWSAQAGKVLNLFYGYKARFASPSQNIATIGSITNPVKIQDSNGNSIDSVANTGQVVLATREVVTLDGGFGYGASFATQATLAANAPGTIFSTGTNANGAIVWSADVSVSSAVAFNSSVIAKSGAAPTTPTDGEPILIGGQGAGAIISNMRMSRSVRIAAAKGLYHISGQIEGQAGKAILYTIL